MISENSFINILIVDDEEDICELVSEILSDEGYSTRVASGYGSAVTSFEQKVPQLVILDVWLGDSDKDGIRLLQYIKAQNPYVPVIMMSGHGTIDVAVSAIQLGAYDFIEKPFESSRLCVSVSKALQSATLQKENENLKIKAKVTDYVLGVSQNVQDINASIERIAPLNGRCLIFGNKFSDKEDVARKIHNSSFRAQGQFSSINCAKCEPRYLELELLGSEVLTEDKTLVNRGLFDKTSSGTLFLDNIETMPYDVQEILLNVCIANSFVRIGGKSASPISLSSRIICGTSVDLKDMVNNGQFIKELYYHINVNKINILPLCKRPDDIPVLIKYYLNQMSKMYSIPEIRIDSDIMDILQSYKWERDVVELKSVADQIFLRVMAHSDKSMTVHKSDLPENIIKAIPISMQSKLEIPCDCNVFDLKIKEAKECFEREYYRAQLRKYAGNIQRMSDLIGIDRSALYRRLKHLKIK